MSDEESDEPHAQRHVQRRHANVRIAGGDVHDGRGLRLQVVDTASTTCQDGDCTCYQGSCYLACATSLDCRGGYSCDPMKKVCVQGSCTADADCVLQIGDVLAKCQSGACKKPCTTDHDCSPAGDISGTTFNGTVCQGGICTTLGCTSDIDCTGTLHEFCVPAPAAAAVNVASAVTN